MEIQSKYFIGEKIHVFPRSVKIKENMAKKIQA